MLRGHRCSGHARWPRPPEIDIPKGHPDELRTAGGGRARTFHTRYRRIIHVNRPPKDFPSGIDRRAFDEWRERYWTHRAGDFRDIAP